MPKVSRYSVSLQSFEYTGPSLVFLRVLDLISQNARKGWWTARSFPWAYRDKWRIQYCWE